VVSFASVYDFVRRVDPAVLNRRSMESLIKAGAFDSLGVPRLGFLLKVDEIIDVTLSRRKDLSLGITTLFATMGADETTTTGRHRDCLSDIEFEKSVKLDFEREMLGSTSPTTPSTKSKACSQRRLTVRCSRSGSAARSFPNLDAR